MRKDKMVTEILGEDLALTPSEVCEKRFKRSMVGGYDTSEVERYLERVADVIEDLVDQVRTLKTAHQEQKVQIEQFREMEGTLRQALASSQRYAEDTLAAAHREAEAIIEEARLKRARTEMDAERIPEALARDIQVLEQQRNRLRLEMLAILETHRRLIEAHVPQQPNLMPSSLTNLGFLSAPSEGEDKEGEAEREERASELPEAVIFDPETASEEALYFVPEESGSDDEALRESDEGGSSR